MPLYLVVNDDENGDNRDLFVIADTPKEAVELTLQFYGLLRTHFKTAFRVYDVPGGRSTRISQPARVILWPKPTTVSL